jgi:hypothetical protein
MSNNISFCGLNCSDCPAFIARQTDDDEKRKETAELWAKEYNADIKPEDINCDGCHSDTGVVIGHAHVCEIRKCGQEKQVENCGFCVDYACEKLNPIFDMAPQAKETLDQMKKG